MSLLNNNKNVNSNWLFNYHKIATKKVVSEFDKINQNSSLSLASNLLIKNQSFSEFGSLNNFGSLKNFGDNFKYAENNIFCYLCLLEPFVRINFLFLKSQEKFGDLFKNDFIATDKLTEIFVNLGDLLMTNVPLRTKFFNCL